VSGGLEASCGQSGTGEGRDRPFSPGGPPPFFWNLQGDFQRMQGRAPPDSPLKFFVFQGVKRISPYEKEQGRKLRKCREKLKSRTGDKLYALAVSQTDDLAPAPAFLMVHESHRRNRGEASDGRAAARFAEPAAQADARRRARADSSSNRLSIKNTRPAGSCAAAIMSGPIHPRRSMPPLSPSASCRRSAAHVIPVPGGRPPRPRRHRRAGPLESELCI
jgi:hypothetical protein